MRIDLGLTNVAVRIKPLGLMSVYLARLSDKGLVTWWPQRSEYYRSGFIFRFLWFGFCLRLSYISPVWEDRPVLAEIAGEEPF